MYRIECHFDIDLQVRYEAQVETSGSEEPTADQDEERAAGDQRRMSQLRDQGLPYRQGIILPGYEKGSPRWPLF